uniref:Serine/arginine repetitive matrix protein 2 n=2 Tax=Caenorhabditis tropicalis TaxID=1561998 RepID=A0A1I7TCC8_9PELO
MYPFTLVGEIDRPQTSSESSEQKPVVEHLQIEMPPKLRERSVTRKAVSTPATPATPSIKNKKSKSRSPSKKAVMQARKASKSPSRSRAPKVEKKTPRQSTSASRSRSRSRSRGRPATSASAAASSSRRSRSNQRTPKTPVEKTIEVADEDEEFLPPRTPKRTARNLTQDPPTTRQRSTRITSQQPVFSPKETRSVVKAKAQKAKGYLSTVLTKGFEATDYTYAKLLQFFSFIKLLVLYPFVFIQNKWNQYKPNDKRIAHALIVAAFVLAIVLFAYGFPKHYASVRNAANDKVWRPAVRYQNQAVSKVQEWYGNARHWTDSKLKDLRTQWNTKSTQTP